MSNEQFVFMIAGGALLIVGLAAPITLVVARTWFKEKTRHLRDMLRRENSTEEKERE